MKSGYKIFLTLFVAVFFAISVVPILEIDTKSEFSSENRKLALFPQEINTNFPKDFEKYLNDRFGFRNYIVSCCKKIMYYVFRTAPSTQVIVGKDGHIFLEEWLFLSEEHSRNTYNSFLSLERVYNTTNFKFPIFFVGVPTPYLIKKDYLPQYVRLRAGNSLDEPYYHKMLNDHDGNQYGEKLSKYFIDKHILYPYEEAVFLNNMGDVFPNLNWHWVAKSPYPDMVAAMAFEKIAKYFNLYQSVFDKNYNLNLSEYRVPCEHYSDMDYMFGFEIENRMFLCRMPDKNVKQVDFYQHYMVDSYKDLKTKANLFLFVNDNPKIDKKILLLSDSYGYGIMESLAEYFSEVFHVQITLLSSYDEIIELIGKYYNFDAVLFVSHNFTVSFPEVFFNQLKKYY